MITRTFAEGFAAEWIDSWNSHDLNRILSHYTSDFRFSSPFIISVVNDPSGTLVGHEKVGAYWSKALERRPDLHFELAKIFVGVTSIVIYYHRHDGRYGAEYFEFDSCGKVVKSSAHYAE